MPLNIATILRKKKLQYYGQGGRLAMLPWKQYWGFLFFKIMNTKEKRGEIRNWIISQGWEISGQQWKLLKKMFREYEDEITKEYRRISEEKDNALAYKNEIIRKLSNGYNQPKNRLKTDKKPTLKIEPEKPKTMFTIPKDLSKYKL